MDTQVAYTTPILPEVACVRKAPRKSGFISVGYMLLDEFGSVFHLKLDKAYKFAAGWVYTFSA